jgi:VanZ family protein
VRRWWVAWGPAALWAAVLFLVSSRPTLPSDLSNHLDKVAHFAAYLVLGFFLARGAAHWRIAMWWALSMGVAYGASDEWHQSFVPGRSPSVGDWIADAAGSAAGVLIFVWLLRSRATSSRAPLLDGVQISER